MNVKMTTSYYKRKEYYERLGVDEGASAGMLYPYNEVNVYFRFLKRHLRKRIITKRTHCAQLPATGYSAGASYLQLYICCF